MMEACFFCWFFFGYMVGGVGTEMGEGGKGKSVGGSGSSGFADGERGAGIREDRFLFCII